MSARILEIGPAALGISGVNLKSATSYVGNVIDVTQLSAFMLVFKIDNTGGGAAGTCKIVLDLLQQDGTTIIRTVDVVTAIPTTADLNALFIIDRVLGADNLGGTLGTSGVDIFKHAGKIKPTITVTQANDGTTCVGSLHLYARQDL